MEFATCQCYLPLKIVKIKRMVGDWHRAIAFHLPFGFIICSDEGLNYLISQNPFRSHFYKDFKSHQRHPAFLHCGVCVESSLGIHLLPLMFIRSQSLDPHRGLEEDVALLL